MPNSNALVASRALAVYLVVWAISDAISLPRNVMHLVYEVRQMQAVKTEPGAHLELYLLRTSILQLLESVLRISLWLAGALWLARFGPKVQQLLSFQSGSDLDPRDVSSPETSEVSPKTN
jgi:hypothetical protein